VSRTWDVVVAGLGAMGSAVVCELARRGKRVVGVDRFAPPHAMGSSHGETRIIREAYFEHPQYVPLVRRAYECWDRLEQETGQSLLVRTGGLMIGPPDGVLVRGAVDSAGLHALPHEMIDAHEIGRRHPALTPASDMVGVWEPRAGILLPERCIAAHLAQAVALGAELRVDEALESWRAAGDGVEVRTARGTIEAEALVVACGAWAGPMLGEPGSGGLKLPLRVERTVLHWFAAPDEGRAFAPDALPIFLLEHAPGRILYGMPELREVGAGVKVARHHEGETTTADTVRREVSRDEIDGMTPLIDAFTPKLAGRWIRSAVCMYTNTPDEDFIIDRHPAHDRVLVLSPCSGHGFKFSSAIGELAADLLTAGSTCFDLSPFRISRFA
jgi:sarcosine oxidase